MSQAAQHYVDPIQDALAERSERLTTPEFRRWLEEGRKDVANGSASDGAWSEDDLLKMIGSRLSRS